MKLGNERSVRLGRRLFAGWLGVATVALAALSAGGCSGGSGMSERRDAGLAIPLNASAHAIHVFAVRPDGTKRRLDFTEGTEVGPHVGGPIPIPKAASAGAKSPAAGGGLHGLSFGAGSVSPQDAPGIAAPGLHLLTFGDGGVPLVGGPTVDAPGTNLDGTAWALVFRAQDA